MSIKQTVDGPGQSPDTRITAGSAFTHSPTVRLCIRSYLIDGGICGSGAATAFTLHTRRPSLGLASGSIQELIRAA